jgi:hypothetical protein
MAMGACTDVGIVIDSADVVASSMAARWAAELERALTERGIATRIYENRTEAAADHLRIISSGLASPGVLATLNAAGVRANVVPEALALCGECRSVQIYGLTTGQTSPTSRVGMKTKSMPFGNLEGPVNPISLALAAGATFVARGFSAEQKHLTELIKKGIQHKGFSFLDVFTPCITITTTAPSSGSVLASKNSRTMRLTIPQTGWPPWESLCFGTKKSPLGNSLSVQMSRRCTQQSPFWTQVHSCELTRAHRWT